MTELKKCPFCGGDGSISMSAKEHVVFGQCWNCGARGQTVKYKGVFVLEEELIEAGELWNRRVRKNDREIDKERKRQQSFVTR